MSTYESLLNQSGIDLTTTIFTGVDDGPMFLQDGYVITRLIENGDIDNNTIQLVKLNSSVYSQTATALTLVQRTSGGGIVGNAGTFTSLAVTGTSTLRNTNPETTNTYDLGASGNVWKDIYATNLTGTLLTASQPNITSLGTLTGLTIAGTSTTRDIVPSIDSTYSIGTNLVRYLYGYFDNVVADTVSATSLSASQFIGGNGTVSAPTFRMVDSDSGIYAPSNGQVAITTNGTQRLNVTDTGLTMSSSILSNGDNLYNVGASGDRFLGMYASYMYGSGGTASLPSFTFQFDQNTGLYRVSADRIGLTVGGLNRYRLDNTSAETDVESRLVNTVPQATDTYDLGASGNIWRFLYAGRVQGTLTTASQPNITSLGTLTGLTVSGNIVPASANTREVGTSSVPFNRCQITSMNGTSVNCVRANMALGTSADCSYQLSAVNNGIFGPSTSSVAISAGGTNRLNVDTTVTINSSFTANNGTGKSLITSNSAGNGRLQLSETVAGNKNPGLELLDNTTFKGGLFYNNATTERVELWGPSNRFLWYSDGDGYMRTSKIFHVDAPETGSIADPGVWIKGGTAGNASIELRGGSQPYIDWVSTTIPTDDFRSRLILTANDNMTLQGQVSMAGAPMNLTLPDGNVNATRFYAGAGSVSSPSISLSADTNTGLYSSTADTLDIATNGVNRVSVGTGAVTTSVPIITSTGSDSAPSFAFSGDTNTGLSNPSADVIGFSTGGTRRATLRDQGLLVGRTTFDSANTNLEVNGDIYGIGNTSAQMYYAALTVTCAVNNTWYKLATVSSALAYGNTIYDSVNAEIDTLAKGKYKVSYSLYFYATTGFITEFIIDRGGTKHNETLRGLFHASAAGSSAPRSIEGSFIYEQTTDSAQSWSVWTRVSNGASQDVVINNGVFTVHRI